MFTSVAYPQSNKQAEVTNRALIQGLKTKLEHVGRTWVEELLSILWFFRTAPRRAIGEMPFSMVYGSKVVLPPKIGTEIAGFLFILLKIMYHSGRRV